MFLSTMQTLPFEGHYVCAYEVNELTNEEENKILTQIVYDARQ